MKILEWIFKVGIAFIFIQTLFFKFTNDPGSIELFTKLGIEPWGRFGTGIIELIASILLFVPKKTWLGAAIAFGTMAGAIIAHLTVLGIDYPDGILFWLATAAFLMSGFLLWRNKANLFKF